MEWTSYILTGWCLFCISTSSLKQQSAGRHVAPLGHFIMNESNPLYSAGRHVVPLWHFIMNESNPLYSAGRHVVPLWHFIMNESNPLYVLTPLWWLLSNVVANANCMVISFDATRFRNHKLPQLKRAGLFDKCRREIFWCYRLLSLTSMIKTYFIEIKDHTNSRSMTYFFIYE
jgi:hypothetical protein